jgi:phage terminase large subunit-like protein
VFAAELCRQSIGRWAGLPLDFYDQQQAFIDDALAFDDDGRRLYRTVVWGIPRKNAKSHTCGAASLAFCSPAEGEGKPLIVMAAGSKDQANPMYDAASDYSLSTPELAQTFLPGKTAITCPWNDGSIIRVAGDGKLNHGLNPYMVMADELHAWVTPKQKENWAALTTAFGARDDAQLWVISTAGWDLETLLGEQYRSAWESEFKVMRPEQGGGGFIVKDPAARLLVHWYAISPDTPFDDLDEWKRANPAPWRTEERIAEDLASKDANESEKRRLYGNQWTSARDRWISAEAWEHAKDEKAEIPEGGDLFVGVDAALSGDTTAVGWAHPLEDGRVVVGCRVWSARKDVPADIIFADGRIDNNEPEAYIRDVLAKRYTVRQIGFDPRFFNDQAERLGDGFVVIAYEQGSGEQRDAWDSFHRATVIEESVIHDGNRVLTAHVAAAAGTLTDRGWKVSKLKQTNPIDGLAAVVIARHLASEPVAVPLSSWA